jgi:hypothetical protein
MKPVERLLQASREEGSLKEEGASFTLSAEQAIAKLARFGLDSPEKGLLRLVQVAHVAGCDGIRISLGRKSLEMAFDGIPEVDLSIATLKQELALDDNNFALALLACLHSGFASGRVEDRTAAWDFDPDGFHPSEPRRERDLITVTMEQVAPVGFWERFRAFLRRRCLDYVTLQAALRHSPLPLLLDGAPLPAEIRPRSKLLYELFLDGPRSFYKDSLKRPPLRVFRYLRDGDRVLESRGAWTTFKTEVRGARLYYFDPEKSGSYRRRSDRKSSLLAHLWVLASSKKEGGHLTFVADGVVVGEATCEFPLPFQGVVSACGLDRDLSGLGVIHNDKLDRLMEHLTKTLAKRLRKFKLDKLPEKVRRVLLTGGFLENKRRKGKKSKPKSKPRVRRPGPPEYDPRSERSKYLTKKRRVKNQFR